MPTTHSAGLYPELAESVRWSESGNVRISSSGVNNAGFAFDGKHDTESVGSTDACSIGLYTTNSHVGTVESVRFKLTSEVDMNDYVDAVFQVSNDNATWSTLYTVETPPREGWNTMDNDCSAASSATYSYVRFSSTSRACEFIELEVVGKLMLSNSATTFSTSAVIFRGSV